MVGAICRQKPKPNITLFLIGQDDDLNVFSQSQAVLYIFLLSTVVLQLDYNVFVMKEERSNILEVSRSQNAFYECQLSNKVNSFDSDITRYYAIVF